MMLIAKAPDEIIKQVGARFANAETERQPYLEKWRQIAPFFSPLAGKYLGEDKKTAKVPLFDRIYNNTPAMAARLFTQGVVSGTMSPNMPWFEQTATSQKQQQKDVAQDEIELRLKSEHDTELKRKIFSESNFYSAAETLFNDTGLFGIGVMYIYEDFHDVIRCYNSPIGEFYLISDERNEIVGVKREFKLNAHQMVAQFGLENVSDKVKNAYKDGKLTTSFNVIHIVDLCADYKKHIKAANDNYRYVSIYFEATEKNKILQIKHHRTKPFVALPFNRCGADVYGIAPSFECLGDVYELEAAMVLRCQTVEKLANPTLVLPEYLKNMATQNDSSIIYAPFENGRPLAQYLTNSPPNLQALDSLIFQAEQRIKQAYFNDILLMISNDNRSGVTAREIDVRNEEKLLLLGPLMEQYYSEFFKVVLERVQEIMENAGIAYQLPNGEKVDFEFQYTSKLAQALKMTEKARIETFMGFVGNLAQAYPEVQQIPNIFNVVDSYAKAINASVKLVNSPDDIAEKQQAAQQQAAQQQMMQNAPALVKGAELLSQTDSGVTSNDIFAGM